MEFISLMELIGTVAFAVSGALVAIERKLDYYGIAFLAIITAVGGGIVRDIIINLPLPVALANPIYIVISLASAAVVILFYKWINKVQSLVNIFDAVGLAAFTAIGAKAALYNDVYTPFVVITLALLTGTGGGVLRDIFAKEIPFVFRKEVYATASMAGAASFLLAHIYLDVELTMYICFAVTLIARLVAIKFNLNLAKVNTTGVITDEKKVIKNKNLSLFWEFFKIGLFTIGGGMAMIPQIQQVAVNDREWLTEEEMVDCIAVSQSMPGVIAINSATYIGKKNNGIKGSMSATAGVILPSFMIIVMVVTLLGAIGENSYLQGAFMGIKAAVCGLILVSAARLGKQILTGVFQWVLAIAAVIAIGIFGINAIWTILAGAFAGIIYTGIKMKTEHKRDSEGEDIK